MVAYPNGECATALWSIAYLRYIFRGGAFYLYLVLRGSENEGLKKTLGRLDSLWTFSGEPAGPGDAVHILLYYFRPVWVGGTQVE